MKARLSVGDVSDIEVTLTITNNVKTWKAIRDQISEIPNQPYPAYSIFEAITILIDDMNKNWEILGDKILT